MNAEYYWACMAFSSWTQCTILSIGKMFHGHSCDPKKRIEAYFILFWDPYLKDYRERWVPLAEVRFL
jgi:hypothetical protein